MYLAETTSIGMTQTKKRIFLVDDHPVVREWLTNLINQQEEFEVCGDAETAEKALEGMAQKYPDLAIVDLSLKDKSGLDLIKNISRDFPKTQVIVFSMHEEGTYAERALRAGAKGYVMKSESGGKILSAMQKVLEGGVYLSESSVQAMAERLAKAVHSGPERVIELLSDRELEIFRLLGQGKTTNQIADLLNISLKTVQSYCARIKEKLHLSNSTELLHEAICVYEQERKL